MECPSCALRLDGFGEVRTQLDAYARQTPAGVAPVAVAGQELLYRLLERADAVRGRRKARRLLLVAAAAVLAVGGPLGALAAAPGGGHSESVRWTASDGGTGAAAVVTAAAKAWGTDVAFELSRPAAPGSCALVAVGRDGSRETVTTWAAPAGQPKPLVTRGGAALQPDQIDHFEVRASDGRRLVTLTERGKGQGTEHGAGPP